MKTIHIARKIFATQKSKITIFPIHFFHLLSLDGGRGDAPGQLQRKCTHVSSLQVAPFNWWTPIWPPKFFACQKLSLQKFSFRKLTLFFPTLGSGRKNKVRPWRIVKASARLSLLKFNRTCVQKSVFGKSMCTFLQVRTLVTDASNVSF